MLAGNRSGAGGVGRGPAAGQTPALAIMLAPSGQSSDARLCHKVCVWPFRSK